MDPKTQKHLPLIDFSNQEASWESIKSQVQVALEEYSCFEAVVEQIPLHLRKSMFDGTQQLFDLPVEIKKLNEYDYPIKGFVGQLPNLPIYEGMGIKDVFSPGNIESFTHLMWPKGNPNFSKGVQLFSEEMAKLETTVRRMIVESFGLEKYMDEHINSANYMVRFGKFDATKSHETNLGIPPHSDKNFVTIVCSNEVKGLEVQMKDGHWITADPSPNSFIVMIGDCLHAWTNGRLRISRHKVLMKEHEARYGITLQCYPKEGYIIKVPEELVDEEHPLLYKPFEHIKFSTFAYSEEGRKFDDTLKAYCGA